MVTTWQLDGIRPIDPSTMRIRITEFVDAVQVKQYAKSFSKNTTKIEVLNQLALLVKQTRQADFDARVPFNNLDMANFENRVQNA